jgi:hypothetical protein
MATDMSVKSGIFPVSVVVSFGSKTGFLQVWSQEPVGIDAEKILQIHLFGMLEGTWCKLDFIRSETFYLGWNLSVQKQRRKKQQTDKTEQSFHSLHFIYVYTTKLSFSFNYPNSLKSLGIFPKSFATMSKGFAFIDIFVKLIEMRNEVFSCFYMHHVHSVIMRS